MKNFALLGVAMLMAFGSFVSSTYADENMRVRNAPGTGVTISATQLTCVRAAVSTREAGVRSAYATLSSTLLAGLDTRASALDAAWTLSDRTARKTARDAAWNTWKSTAKTARDAFRMSRNATWDTFRSDVRACKVSSTEVESVSAQMSDVQ